MSKIVLYIGSMQRGGAQRVMSIIASALHEAGHDVTLITDIASCNNDLEYDLKPFIHRIPLEVTAHSYLANNLIRIIRIRRIIKKIEPNCVLSFLAQPNIRMLIASYGLQCRKIVSVRNDPYHEYGYGVRKRFINILFRLADALVLQTDTAGEYFSSAIRKKSIVIPNPIEDYFFKGKWNPNSTSIIAIGRLEAQKNYEMLLKAFSNISREYPSNRLTILGNGKRMLRLQELSKKLDIQDRVVFKGVVRDVRKELEGSLFYVLTSDYEGLPNAMMEAMAVGLPIVATDCPSGGPRFLADDGKYCKLIPCGNEEMLILAMKELLSSEEVRERYHMFSKERSQRFRTEKVERKWLELILLEGT